MLWQDYAILFIQTFFLAALLPSLKKGADKPVISTSLMTGLALSALSFVFLTLNMYLGAFMTLLNSLAWYILAYQKIKSGT